MLILHFANILFVTISCAFLNRWRGGWFDKFQFKNKIVEKIVTSQTFSRTLITLICCYSIFFNLGFPSILEALAIFLLVLYFSLVAGWGTWFSIKGTDGWKHNVDAFWVEILMTWISGKHWIPKGEKTVRSDSWLGRFTIEKSPNGRVRSQDWYLFYNFFAMSLRGLGFGAVITFIFCYLEQPHPSMILFCAISYMMGLCYYIWYDLKESGVNFPSFLDGNTKLGEFLYGGLILGGGLYFCSFLVSIS